MKITICDICKGVDDKIIVSVYRRGFKGWPKADVCENHKTYGLGDTPQDFNKTLMGLVYGDPKSNKSELSGAVK